MKKIWLTLLVFASLSAHAALTCDSQVPWAQAQMTQYLKKLRLQLYPDLIDAVKNVYAKKGIYLNPDEITVGDFTIDFGDPAAEPMFMKMRQPDIRVEHSGKVDEYIMTPNTSRQLAFWTWRNPWEIVGFNNKVIGHKCVFQDYDFTFSLYFWHYLDKVTGELMFEGYIPANELPKAFFEIRID